MAARDLLVRPAQSRRLFFFNDTATTEIYTLSLHDALPIFSWNAGSSTPPASVGITPPKRRSEEHTSELQSPYVISYAVFCLKQKNITALYVMSSRPSQQHRRPRPVCLR